MLHIISNKNVDPPTNSRSRRERISLVSEIVPESSVISKQLKRGNTRSTGLENEAQPWPSTSLHPLCLVNYNDYAIYVLFWLGAIFTNHLQLHTYR
jgi:hypothetical protein